jgi:hypothetical protein
MFASIFVLFAIVASVFGAEKNLRTGQAAVEKAEAHRAINALKSMGKAFAKKVSNDAMEREKMFTRARQSKMLSSVNMEDPRVVRDGYVVQRSRPNADCSGVVSTSHGTAMALCQVFPSGGSGRMSCSTMGEDPTEAQILYEVYSSTDCSGPPEGIMDAGIHPKCAFNFQDYGHKGFTSTTLQCSPKEDLPMEEKSGFLMEVRLLLKIVCTATLNLILCNFFCSVLKYIVCSITILPTAVEDPLHT